MNVLIIEDDAALSESSGGALQEARSSRGTNDTLDSRARRTFTRRNDMKDPSRRTGPTWPRGYVGALANIERRVNTTNAAPRAQSGLYQTQSMTIRAGKSVGSGAGSQDGATAKLAMK